jgi:hypothetical protein
MSNHHNDEPPAAGWGFTASDDVPDPNSHPHAGIAATFRDGSHLALTHLGIDGEGRQRYAYTLTDPTAGTIDAGEDLRSGVGDPVDHAKMLAAWTGFAGADAEAYQSTMDGNPAQEWAYQHDDELAALSCELEPDPDRGDSPAGSEPDRQAEHADYPHWPGTLPDCPDCPGRDDTDDDSDGV